jgi:hypothetical protein
MQLGLVKGFIAAVVVSIVLYCAKMVTLTETCAQKTGWRTSLCCLLGIWAEGSVYRYSTLFVVGGTVVSILVLLALRRGRENLPAGNLIGGVLAVMLWGLLSSIVLSICR